MNIRHLTSFGIKYLIQIASFIFVSIQSYRCFVRFFGAPTGTRLKLESPKNYPYPELTFCPNRDEYFTETLSYCNLTVKQYFEDAIWSGDKTNEHCRDPKKLFEMLVDKFSYTIPEIDIYPFDFYDLHKLGDRIFVNENSTDIKESPTYGRCLSWTIPRKSEVYRIQIDRLPVFLEIHT